jgi:hypothetical protein
MTPATPPPDEQGMKAERAAYLDFESQLPDDFHVYYSLELLSPEAREAEIDFLILHRQLGMLVVECKGGGVRRNSQGVWERTYRGSREKLDKSPWKQARCHMHLLEDVLEQRYDRQTTHFSAYRNEHGHFFPLTYGYAVALPFADGEQANPPLEANDHILFDSSDFDDIEAPVRAAMSHFDEGYDKPPLNEDEFARFRKNVLYPTTSLAESLAARIRAEDRAFERLSDEQKQVIRALDDHERLLVEGGAGTGKSLLALEAARMLADEGRRVLLTCFNRKLCKSLDRKIDGGPERAGGVVVDNFHGLCWDAIETSDAEIEPPNRSDKEASREFWEERAPYLLLDALDAGRLDGWDAIVVDEAQDFEAEWWDILQTGLADGDDGRLVAFHDPTQDLFERDNRLPDFQVTYPLTYNFRNTTRICETVDQLHPDDLLSHPRTPDGEPPEVRRYNSREGQRNAIDRLVRELVEQQDLTPAHLAILTPRTKANSVLADCESIGGVPITTELDDADHKLLHDSIGGFKGLERDVVIFADVDPDHDRCNPNARYVAASRAVNRLYVFEKSDWMADV